MSLLDVLWPFGGYRYHSKGRRAHFENTAHQWILATRAISGVECEEYIDLVGGVHPTKAVLDDIKFNNLKENWGVSNREELLALLERLKLHADGNDKGIFAWDSLRYIRLSQWGLLVNYLTESEAWEMMRERAKKLQETFHSWQELGLSYLEGRKSYEGQRQTSEVIKEIFQNLLKDQNSPWVQIDFKGVPL